MRPRYCSALVLAIAVVGFVQADEGPAARSPDVVFVPTPGDVVAKMLDLAEVKRSDVLYDLGCGDGRIVVAAAKRYGCQAKGVDLNPVRVRESRENAIRNGVSDLATFERKDIFEVDLSDGTVVTLYLLPEMNLRLVPQLQKMKPGSRVVAHDFGIDGYAAEKSVALTSREDGVEHHVLLWTVPLKKSED